MERTDNQQLKAETKKTKRGFLVGFWHYGVILTYLSVVSGIVGICFSIGGHKGSMPEVGVFCLLLSGFCDAFDGAVAKTRKNRTEEDKMFGERIDSSSDLIAFGVAPVMIGFGMHVNRWFNILAYAFFILMALVRLAYFDVTEEIRTRDKDCGKRKYYEGLPVTNVAVIIPVFFMLATCFTAEMSQSIVMMIGYIATGLAFVIRFKMLKFSVKQLIVVMVILVAVLTTVIVLKYNGVLPHEIFRTWDK